jgi:hypothetical protein
MTPTAGALVADLCGWIDRLFPDTDRGERLARALIERFGNDGRAVTEEVCRDIEAVAQGFSRHLELVYVGDGSLVPDREPPGWRPPDPREVRLRAGQVRQVTRRDGVGVLALDGQDPVHLAAPYLEAAFTLLRDASGVVLDLRRNGGGDLDTVMLVLDWLLGEPTHICDVDYRHRTRQWWTTGRLSHRAPPPVSVMVGPDTYSSGEGLAYHIQSRVRARVVGQPTPGAADHVTPVNLNAHVRALLPEARVRDAVTRTNWEGTGVVPDIPCEQDDALQAALDALQA